MLDPFTQTNFQSIIFGIVAKKFGLSENAPVDSKLLEECILYSLSRVKGVDIFYIIWILHGLNNFHFFEILS